MTDSLIEELPKIIAQGKREAQKILDGISDRNKVTLQTNELVLPTKAKGGYFAQGVKEIQKDEWFNRMIYGDNLLAMQALISGDPNTNTPSMRGKIDLIYIDPPFDSKTDYTTKIHLPNVDIEQKPTVIEQFAYSDTWKNGTVSYLKMITSRLILMRELLSDQGSIYVHIDWHVGHYVKIIMDEIFGKNNFINEIIWKRQTAHSDYKQGAKHLGRIHDTILLYSKTENFILNTLFTPYSKDLIEQNYKHRDKNGRRYSLGDITGPGGASKGNPRFEFLGVTRYWAFSKETLEKMYKEGKIVQTSPGAVPRRKRYLEEMPGIPLQSIWTDVNPVQSQSFEKKGYSTQKPEALIRRIIESSTNKNSTVADFFAGSGTVGAVAEKMGRKWIMSDLGKPACMIMRKRLIDQDAKPFLYQSIGDYQKEQFEKSSFRRIGDLAHVIVNLYGALPLSQDGMPTNMGHIKGSKTLVFVDSPAKMTGYNTLKKAQELRASFMGGWDKVVVLGWNFVTNIGEVIQNLKDDKMEVLVIPPDLLDRIKTKSSVGEVRFSSLQYLTVKPVKIQEGGKEKDELTVQLDNYVLLSPDALPLDQENKEKLEKVIEKDPLSLIEYWSIDPDYDGEVFRSKWQDYRENNEDLRIKKSAKIVVPKVKGKRRVCVKAVDVFGFESATVQEVR